MLKYQLKKLKNLNCISILTQKKFIIISIISLTLYSTMASDMNNIQRRYQDLKQYALSGNANAQNSLGLLYAQGHDIERNDSEAVRWFTQAAVQNHLQAQYNLATLYLNRHTSVGSYADAAQWFMKAAKKNYPPAQNGLGFMYEQGLGFTRNYYTAMRWYRRAAQQSYANAQNNVGSLYEVGLGVRRNLIQAVHWYRCAVQQSYAPAQVNLGSMYEQGLGVERDRSEAVLWYRRALKQNYRPAFNKLKILLNFKVSQQSVPIPLNMSSDIEHHNILDKLLTDIRNNYHGKLTQQLQGYEIDLVGSNVFYTNQQLINKVMITIIALLVELKRSSLLTKGCLITPSIYYNEFLIDHSCHFLNRRIIIVDLFNDHQYFMSIGKTNVRTAMQLQSTLSFLNDSEQSTDFTYQGLEPLTTYNPFGDLEAHMKPWTASDTLRPIYRQLKETLMQDTILRNKIFQKNNPELFQ